MYIKYWKQLKNSFNLIKFYPLDSQLEAPIAFVYWFFHDAYGYIKREGISSYLEDLYSKYDEIMGYQLVKLSTDYKNNLIYISEGYLDYRNKPTTPEIEDLLDQANFIKLCQMNFFEYAVMTKENFGHIIVAYDQIWKNDSKFALLYQDENDWYDILPFDTQEAMQQFVADHTKPE